MGMEQRAQAQTVNAATEWQLLGRQAHEITAAAIERHWLPDEEKARSQRLESSIYAYARAINGVECAS